MKKVYRKLKRIVKDYIEIQKFRFGDRISLNVSLSEETMKSRVPVFSLQLAVENAIKHGMEKTINNVEIRVSDHITESTREFIIEDNGRGIRKERLMEVRAMLQNSRQLQKKDFSQKGLVNLNERIRQYFGNGYGLEIGQRKNGGVVLRIILPKGEDEDDKGSDRR